MAVSGKRCRSVARVFSLSAKMAKKSCLSWYDKLGDSDKKWCRLLRSEFKNGSHTVTAESLAKVVSQELKTKITGAQLRYWLRQE